MKKRHKDNHNLNRNRLFYFKWFVIWGLIYTALYIVLNFFLSEFLGQYGFFKVKFVYILITGLCFSIAARIIYDLIKKKKVYMGGDVFVFWALTYGLSIWFFEALFEILVRRSQLSWLTSTLFIEYLFIGFGVAIMIKLVKRIEFGIRQPSQIMTGVILMLCGALFFRFSVVIFGSFWPEGMAWSWLFGLALLIGGFLMILAWWRNNVLQHRIGIKFGHWK